jgi:hypothetical protein
LAQDGQQIVMRRPIPFQNAIEGSSPIVPPGTNPPEANPPEANPPGIDSPVFTPLPPPVTGVNDWDILKPDDPLPWFGYDFNWRAGPWQGEAVCGVQTELNRQVECIASGEGQEMAVDPQYCIDAGNMVGNTEIPATYYVGDKAGCEYTPSFTYTDWVEPFGGNPLCSASATRNLVLTCRDSNNNIVNPLYCSLNLVSGGVEFSNYLEPEIGNFESCEKKWLALGRELGCKPDGDPNSQESGPVFYRINTGSVCIAPDGSQLNDEECEDEPRPPVGIVEDDRFKCEKTYLALAGNACKGTKIFSVPGTFGDARDMTEGGGADMCLGVNAGCCAVQLMSKDDGQGYKPYIVATVDPPYPDHFGYYLDRDTPDGIRRWRLPIGGSSVEWVKVSN